MRANKASVATFYSVLCVHCSPCLMCKQCCGTNKSMFWKLSQRTDRCICLYSCIFIKSINQVISLVAGRPVLNFYNFSRPLYHFVVSLTTHIKLKFVSYFIMIIVESITSHGFLAFNKWLFNTLHGLECTSS